MWTFKISFFDASFLLKSLSLIPIFTDVSKQGFRCIFSLKKWLDGYFFIFLGYISQKLLDPQCKIVVGNMITRLANMPDTHFDHDSA